MSYKNLRSKLQEEGVLIINNDKLVFTKDYLFPSPSQAAAVIVGYAINGRHSWCLTDGTTLKEHEEKQIKKVILTSTWREIVYPSGQNYFSRQSL